MNTHRNERNELIQEILDDKRYKDKYGEYEVNLIILSYSDRDMDSLEKVANENGMKVGDFVMWLVNKSFDERNALKHFEALQKATLEVAEEQKQSVSI